MRWREISRFLHVSECRQYELYGAYFNGHFAWRGRIVETDTLVCASQDRDMVRLTCERHAAKVEAEASA